MITHWGLCMQIFCNKYLMLNSIFSCVYISIFFLLLSFVYRFCFDYGISFVHCIDLSCKTWSCMLLAVHYTHHWTPMVCKLVKLGEWRGRKCVAMNIYTYTSMCSYIHALNASFAFANWYFFSIYLNSSCFSLSYFQRNHLLEVLTDVGWGNVLHVNKQNYCCGQMLNTI